MFNEVSWDDNPERKLREGVDDAIQQPQKPAIHPLLWLETQNILRDVGVPINVEELDKPLFNRTEQ